MGVGGIAAAVSAAVSIASLAYAATQSPPSLNTGNAQAEGVKAQADMLPWQRLYEQAAETGGQAIKYGYTQTTESEVQRQALQQQLNAVNRLIQQGTQAAHRPGPPGAPDPVLRQLQSQASGLQTQIANIPVGGGTVYLDSGGNVVPKNQAVVDFAGLGQAEVQGKVAEQMAAVQLGLQQKYGVQFAEQAKQQLAESDPEGTAARAELYNLIQQQNNAPFDQPVADVLDTQVGAQLASGEKLDPAMRAMLDQAVGQAQAARGQDPNADTQQFATPLETGFEGQQRELAAMQKAAGWLASGSTPEDVQYRHEQQNLANLGAFVQGQTPEAQFGQLSSRGAQQGTTPFVPGQALPLAQNGADQTGLGYATSGWLQNLRYQESQANPWMAGLSSALSGVGALNHMGAFGSSGGTGGGGGGP